MSGFYTSIKDYFLLGDLHTACLVSKKASVDWLCLPNFDSPSFFGRILDSYRGGNFEIDYVGYEVRSRYLRNSPVVEFTFQANHSEFKLKDFMVPRPYERCRVHHLVRKFEGLKGLSRVQLRFNPRPDYGKGKVELVYKSGLLEGKTSEGLFRLHFPDNSQVVLHQEYAEVSFGLEKNQSKEVILQFFEDVEKSGETHFSESGLFEKTQKFWQEWVSRGRYFDYHQDLLVRSAITLKLMQYYPTGAIVAAPTTSLPESIGGERNWDYRYVWVRDATFTLYALYVLGYTEEAVKFFQFIQSIVKKESKKDFDLQLMYNIEGKPAPEEVSLNYLAGYRDSSPVRVGNGAAKQFQLDVYGSLIDAYYFVSQRGVKIDQENKKVILNLLEKIRQRWSEKDNGIWEVRSGLQDYTYSKVMSWVGADRAYRLSSKLKMSKSEKDYCRNLSNQIETWVWENCYSSREKKLYQYPGSLLQDSTNLLFILLQFLDRHENITKEVILNTAKELQEKEIFVYRYLGKDGLFGKEGAFVLCTFWLISALAMVGEVEKAEKLFDKFSFIFNEQSLLAEETDPETGDFLGNYPQAFSHIGLIMSLYYLHKYKSKLN